MPSCKAGQLPQLLFLGCHTDQCAEWQAECASHTQGSPKDRSPLAEGPQGSFVLGSRRREVWSDSATTPCFRKTLLHRSSIWGRPRKRRPPEKAEGPDNMGELGAEVLGRNRWHHYSLRPWNLTAQLEGAATVILGQASSGANPWEIPSFPQEPIPGPPACPSRQPHRKALTWSPKKLFPEPRHLQLLGRPVLSGTARGLAFSAGCCPLLRVSECGLASARPSSA